MAVDMARRITLDLPTMARLITITPRIGEGIHEAPFITIIPITRDILARTITTIIRITTAAPAIITRGVLREESRLRLLGVVDIM